MRIAFITTSLGHGGAERHSITVMNGLAERGHECHAVYLKNDASQLDRIRVQGKESVFCADANGYLDRSALKRFTAHLEQLQPDAIVAANTYALMYAALARRSAKLKVPLVVTFHSTNLPEFKDQIKMLIDRFFILSADCLVFVCDNQRRYWQRRGMFARRTEVIHNGINTQHFSADEFSGEAGRLRQQLGITDTDFVVGMLAVLRPEKNHLQMIDAIARLRQQGIPAKALLIGDGIMRTALEARARDLGITQHVIITGACQEVRPYITACNVLALCSTGHETFSLAALEAMAMGKPVVHADIGGANEMIEQWHNGALFPVGDTEALVQQLALLSGRGSAEALGCNARRVVQTRFSENVMLDRYEQLLLDLCQKTCLQPLTDTPKAAIETMGRYIDFTPRPLRERGRGRGV